MEITSIIVTYSCSWWILFLMSLPIGNQINDENLADPNKETKENRSVSSMLIYKGIIITIIAIPISFIILWLISSGRLDFLIKL